MPSSSVITLTGKSVKDFNETLKRYLKVNKRSLPDVLNEKGFRISGGAIRNTKRADADRIRAELGAKMTTVMGKRGKPLKKKRLALNDDYGATLAVVLVIAKLRKAGRAIPQASELKELALKEVRSRIRSVGFISSGWVPSYKKLKKFARGASAVNMPNTFGKQKGSVQIARESQGSEAFCIIRNSAGQKKKHAQALDNYGRRGLEAAVAAETASMKQYLERKLRENAHEAGIKTT